jgi:hypothetical protein|tara:strand:- start:3582 stop:3737 length:156 start_codon:yes stop_codon:yes gene_type:complete
MASQAGGLRQQTSMAIKAGGAYADSLFVARYCIVRKGIDGKEIIVQRFYII